MILNISFGVNMIDICLFFLQFDFQVGLYICCLTIIVCTPHYYGRNCNTPCGQCEGDGVCDSVTGNCPNGCKQHWTPPNCEGKETTYHYK